MNIAVLYIEKEEFLFSCQNAPTQEAARVLECKGHEIREVLTIVGKSEAKRAVEFLKAGTDALLVAGDCGAFREAFGGQYTFLDSAPVFEIDGLLCILAPELTCGFIEKTVLPALNSKTKVYYATAAFKTFGASAGELNTLLSDCIRNKNKIAVSIIERSHLECEVRVRYSNKTKKEVLDALCGKIAALLSDYAYSEKCETLAEAVSAILRGRNQKVCIAESFTGGGVTRALVAIGGASQIVKEGIVSYSVESKMDRLDVEPLILEEFGAASIETVYEMAANLLMFNPDCAYAVATTGNAEPQTDVIRGLTQAPYFFVAAGDSYGIHIYRYEYTAPRNDVIEFGVKAALFRLLKKMTEVVNNE
ncbi:MAG: CinA family protein [Firmicutes bacterium]|nr:CinA family protein [Bacillota bacterium]